MLGLGETNAPCKNCQDRSATCHSTCNKYLTWRKEWEEKKKKEREEKSWIDYEAIRRYRISKIKRGLR